MASPISIALVSYQVKYGDKEANIQLVEDVLREHADAGIQIFLLPELSISGMMPPGEKWDLSNVSHLAERIPDGPYSARVVELARQYRTVICAGLVEESNGRYFITHFLCGPDGYIGKQRKLFPSRGVTNIDALFGGEQLHIHDLYGYRCVILSCADWILPEGVYLAGLNEADLILAPTDGFSLSQEPLLRSVAAARVIDTNSFLAATFGGETPLDEVVMAGLIASPTGFPSESMLFETRRSGEVKVIGQKLTLQCSQHKWGSYRDRVQTMLINLDNYRT